MLTVKELRDMLNGYPDDTPVVVHTEPDGNYPNFSAEIDSVYDKEQTIKCRTYLGNGNYRIEEQPGRIVVIDSTEF
jgi:hypothetical protein